MFQDLKKYFSERDESISAKDILKTDEEIQIAMLALLLTAGRADQNLESSELNKIIGVMYRECGVTEQQIGHFVEVADFLLGEKGKVDYFINLLNIHCSPEKKQIIVGVLWRVIIADGKVDKFEGAIASEIRTRLGLTLEQAVYARRLAETRETQFLMKELMKDEA